MASFPTGSELEFNKFLVTEYLKYGSVDEVLKIHRYDLPISYASYQRVLDKWGIIKAVGPNNKLSETISFLTKFVEQNIPLDVLYKKMPSSFKTSAATLYRILSYIKEGITRRIATGLVITPFDSTDTVLIAQDFSAPRTELGKNFGSLTIPITFSNINDLRRDAILRTLQHEVFSNLAIDKKLKENLIPKKTNPFMYLDIADVRIEVFHLRLPEKYSQAKYLSSFKLKNYKFIKLEKVIQGGKKYRVGMKDIAQGFVKYKDLSRKNLRFNPIVVKSEINYAVVSNENEI